MSKGELVLMQRYVPTKAEYRLALERTGATSGSVMQQTYDAATIVNKAIIIAMYG